MSGLAISVSLAISPLLFVPISRTATSWSEFISRRVNGNPIRLLKLPGLFRIFIESPAIDAIISFVVVFPELPVTATTGILNRSLWKWAMSPSAFKVSSTQMTGTSPETSSTAFSFPL